MFYEKNFEKKIFYKLSINWRYRVITIISRYKYFHVIKLGTNIGAHQN